MFPSTLTGAEPNNGASDVREQACASEEVFRVRFMTRIYDVVLEAVKKR